MTRVIAMKLLCLLPGGVPAKVATAHLRDYQGNNRLIYTVAGTVLVRNVYFPFLKIIVYTALFSAYLSLSLHFKI